MHQNVALHATDADFQKSSVDSCGTSAPLRHRLHTYTLRADSAQNGVSGEGEGADRVRKLGLWYVPIPAHMWILSCQVQSVCDDAKQAARASPLPYTVDHPSDARNSTWGVPMLKRNLLLAWSFT